jgi:exosortase
MGGVSIENLMNPMAKRIELSDPGTESARTNHVRALGFALVSVLPLVVVWMSMRSLASVTLGNDTYSHIPLIPVISSFLIYSERQRIFSEPSWGWGIGALFVLAGVACFVLGELGGWTTSAGTGLSIEMLGVVLAWVGAFAVFFGAKALHAASFPFLFLVFMIPIPEPLLSPMILALQKGSADAAALVFSIFRVPVFRQGLVFFLPGVAIRVAEECSGIRSSIALVIMAVLAGHMFLKSFWKKTLLCLLVFPVAILKNGFRIATLSTLAAYVSPGFLFGRLHRYGGLVFFVFGLVPLALFLMAFQKSEHGKTILAKDSGLGA